MVFATKEFYLENFLVGRKPKLPLAEFSYWEQQARIYINQVTFDRIDQSTLDGSFFKRIGLCTCALAEYLYMNEGYENKQSESVSGRSVSYIQGTEYTICLRYLGMTGLMYRGAGDVTS